MFSKLILLFFLLNQGESIYHAFRKIPGKIPIISDEILNTKFSAKDLDSCQKSCLKQGFMDLVYSRHGLKNEALECICLPKYSWYKHGLVNADDMDLYISLSEDGILNDFLFLDSSPMQSMMFKDRTKSTLQECALACYNREGPAGDCHAFLYDVVTNECVMYSESHLRRGGFDKASFVNGVNTLYFEKLSRFERYFEPVPHSMLANTHQPKEVDGKFLEDCSVLCFQSITCKSFNYIPKKKKCQLLQQTRESASDLKSDTEAIYFEMIPSTGCGTRRSDARKGWIRSPGWPGSLSSNFMNGTACSWDVLTPWGLSIKVKYSYFNLEALKGSCQQSLQIGDKSPQCLDKPPSQTVFGQTGEVTSFKLAVANWPEEKQTKNVGFYISYSMEWASNGKLRDTGVLASPNFPKKMKKANRRKYTIIGNDQTVKIEFQFFNLQGSGPSIERAFLSFQSKGKTIKCEGPTYKWPCQQQMTFKGDVAIEFYSGSYNREQYPPGFKLSYIVGDNTKSLPELKGTHDLLLTEGKSLINQTNLQKQFSSVKKYEVRIKNPDKGGLVGLRILNLYFAEPDVPSEPNEESLSPLKQCTRDNLRVEDPYSQHINFTFCGHSTPKEIIYSTKDELRVYINVDALPFTEKFMPERTFVIEAFKKNPQLPALKYIEADGVVKFPENGNRYLPNTYMRWIINGTEDLEPKVTFRYAKLAEFSFQSRHFCDNDRLSVVYGGGSFSSCGANDSMSSKEVFTNNNRIDLTFKSDDILSGQGFLTDVEMITTSRCKPSEVIKVQANEVDYLMSENYPAPQISKTCAWQIQAENSTGVFITVIEGGKLSIDEENSQGQSGYKTLGKQSTYHVPTDSIISWSGANNRLLATLQSLDLTTTSTTTESTTEATTTTTSTSTTTTTTTTTTTAAPTTTTATTSTVLPPLVGRNKGGKPGLNTGSKIGIGVVVPFVVVIALAVIIWKIRNNQREPLIEPGGEFHNSNLYVSPGEVNRKYRDQREFKNPLYGEHSVNYKTGDHNSREDSVYVDMNNRDHNHHYTNGSYTSDHFGDEYQ